LLANRFDREQVRAKWVGSNSDGTEPPEPPLSPVLNNVDQGYVDRVLALAAVDLIVCR
jgi:hypothetical protein